MVMRSGVGPISQCVHFTVNVKIAAHFTVRSIRRCAQDDAVLEEFSIQNGYCSRLKNALRTTPFGKVLPERAQRRHERPLISQKTSRPMQDDDSALWSASSGIMSLKLSFAEKVRQARALDAVLEGLDHSSDDDDEQGRCEVSWTRAAVRAALAAAAPPGQPSTPDDAASIASTTLRCSASRASSSSFSSGSGASSYALPSSRSSSSSDRSVAHDPLSSGSSSSLHSGSLGAQQPREAAASSSANPPMPSSSSSSFNMLSTGLPSLGSPTRAAASTAGLQRAHDGTKPQRPSSGRRRPRSGRSPIVAAYSY